MKQSDGETIWKPGQGTSSGWMAGHQGTSGPLRNPGPTSGKLRNPGLTSGSVRGSGWASEPVETPLQGPARAGKPGEWGEEEEDDPEGVVAFRREFARAEAAAAPDPLSIGLVRVVLFLLACVAAYSLQSHSQRHSVPGLAANGRIAQVSYDAGWPLAYAHIAVGSASVPLADVEPTPAFRYINPAFLGVDVLALALPLWVLLECLWALWASILKRYGPRSMWRRLVAFGVAALPALLWVVAGLGLGLIVVLGPFDPATLPKVLLPVLAPLLPGFGLAAGAAAVLSIPPSLWRLDVGLYLLALVFPLLLLTAFFYVYGCLFGRGLRRLFKRR